MSGPEEKTRNSAPFIPDELTRICSIYFAAVDSARILAASDVEQALNERRALLSGIARACTTPSDNPHANTMALKLQNEIKGQYPNIDPGAIASILSQAFTEAARLCTPPSSHHINAEARNILEDSLAEGHAGILELYARTFT